MKFFSVSPLLRDLRFVPLTLGIAALNVTGLAAIATAASDWNQFDVCMTELTSRGVANDAAAAGCSQALIPKEMSQCVALITDGAGIAGTVALQSCFQVRRPVDLGHCVVDIQNSLLNGYSPQANTTKNDTENNLSLSALNSCRQSLLPGRHSQCVIALGRGGQGFTPQKAMDSCLAAEDFPRDLFPAYSQGQ